MSQDAEVRLNAALKECAMMHARLKAVPGECWCDQSAIPVIHEYRLALKCACQALRRVIASQPDPEIHAIQTRQLGNLKRMHYNLIMAEQCSVIVATRKN